MVRAGEAWESVPRAIFRLDANFYFLGKGSRFFQKPCIFWFWPSIWLAF